MSCLTPTCLRRPRVEGCRSLPACTHSAGPATGHRRGIAPTLAPTEGAGKTRLADGRQPHRLRLGRTEIAQARSHPVLALPRIQLEREARVDHASAGEVRREFGLVKRRRLEDPALAA